MDWWILELVKGLGLIVLAVVLHRVIRGFGKDYVSQIGRNLLVLVNPVIAGLEERRTTPT